MRRWACQAGVSMAEVIVTMLIAVVGLLATMGSFVGFGEASYEAQRRSAMVLVAQREIERIRALPYAQVGLAKPAPAGAPALPQAFASEPMVSGGSGVVQPGAETIDLDGMSGRIYRYVTWRRQGCPLLRAKVVSGLAEAWGQDAAAVEASLSELCPGSQQTKRITILVEVNGTESGKGPIEPVVLSSIKADPSSGPLANGSFQGLRVDGSAVVQPATGQPSASPEPSITPQQWYLYDTACSKAARLEPTGDHPVRETASDLSGCAGAADHDLMGEAPVPGSPSDPLYNVSTDVHRAVDAGLALRQDTRAGGCDAVFAHPPGDEQRRGAIHTWATAAAAQQFSTPATGGRATFTFWTQTASGTPRPGRLCFALRRSDTGAVLGWTEYALPAWPAEPTQLAVAFDVAAATMPAGTRLLLTVRNPSVGESDLILLHDHAAYQTALSVTMKAGSELR